jgi:hypothetical protein
LSKPEGDARIPLETQLYFRARNKNRAYDAVIREFLKSGLSQATLARRLGKRPEIISRLLGAPGNWTLDTVSDLLLAISGSEVKYEISSPFERRKRNYNGPQWLETLPREPQSPSKKRHNRTRTRSSGSIEMQAEFS